MHGRPRLRRCLRNRGIHISERRLARLMRELGLFAKKRRRLKRTNNSEHNQPVAPSLLNREFSVSAPIRVWCSDIIYIRAWDGWVYLCVVIDLFSRKNIGWSLAGHLEISLVRNALQMAIGRRNPWLGVIFHSDRGSQFAARSFRGALKEPKFIQSMSRAGGAGTGH